MNTWHLLLGMVLLAISNQASSACPVCNSQTGREVRAGIFGENFGSNLLAVAAPIPLLLFSALAISHSLGKEDKTHDQS